MPPLTVTYAPVTCRMWPASRARTAPATSSGSASRRSGVCARTWSSTAAGRNPLASVSVRPGATTLTGTPCGPRSMARLRARPSSADLATEIAPSPSLGFRDCPLLIATIEPSPRWIMPGATAWQGRNAAASWARTYPSRPANGAAVSGPIGSARAPAAFRTSASTGPSADSASRTIRPTSAASHTSAWTATARPPPRAIAATTPAASSPLRRKFTATAAPCRANRRAVAAPIPRAAPVTSTVRPASSWLSIKPLQHGRRGDAVPPPRGTPASARRQLRRPHRGLAVPAGPLVEPAAELANDPVRLPHELVALLGGRRVQLALAVQVAVPAARLLEAQDRAPAQEHVLAGRLAAQRLLQEAARSPHPR